jgi:hypothetical protein
MSRSAFAPPSRVSVALSVSVAAAPAWTVAPPVPLALVLVPPVPPVRPNVPPLAPVALPVEGVDPIDITIPPEVELALLPVLRLTWSLKREIKESPSKSKDQPALWFQKVFILAVKTLRPANNMLYIPAQKYFH